MDTTFTIKIEKGKGDKSEVPVQVPVKGSIPIEKSLQKQTEIAEFTPVKNLINSSF
jgi:hypothetical protein